MLLTPVHPVLAAPIDLATESGRVRLAAEYAPREGRYLRVNMITSLTGAARGADGTSDTLTNRVDRTVLGVIRDQADAVLVGAATVRAEGYLVPRRATLAILTVSGDLRGHRLDGAGDRVIVLCPRARAAEVSDRLGIAGARVVGVDGADHADDVAPEAVLRALRAEGLTRVVCEGGPRVAGMFAAAGLVDEFCVTVAPTLVPTERPFLRLPAEAQLETEVVGMLVDDASFSYLRLRPRRPVPARAATA